MQRVGETFYGRAQAYRVALEAAAEGPLVAALERNIYGGPQAAAAAAPRLAAYVREAVRDLTAQDSASLAAGALRFRDPANIPGPAR